MSELEQLRKEVNELRERVVALEKRPAQFVVPYNPTQPVFVPQWQYPHYPVTCSAPTKDTITATSSESGLS